ncbi:Uma2 family endonuclease [Streptacidiphilus melanogenes]|uniref:Uma2 family endonuclease n=1 Tax=Streptacidiphilus melanogenes TaxID=411235 RepID=UPI0009FDE171|nr:Uma2 family endonuclease [Streptacidiphilus melanogenes]
MTAEPMHDWPYPWPRPPDGGYTVDDLLTLPDLPPHTELIDGSLVFVSPQKEFHSLMLFLLEAGLRTLVPDDLRVRREMAVVIDRQNSPVPDVCVVKAAATGPGRTRYRVEDVVLAIEVVSPESASRDRDTKPHKYARAGIGHYWLADSPAGENRPVLSTYQLDPDKRSYELTGIHHDRLVLDVPFPIDIDLTGIDKL